MTARRPAHPTLYRLALLALVLAAFALRLYRLDAESLWYDEGVTAYVAGLNPAALTRWTAADIQPPLYYYLVAAWGRLAGWSEWALRAPSAFFGTLTVPLLAAVAARLFDRRSATLLAALITTVHPFLIYYSQEARNYALLLALGVGVAYCILHIAYWEKRGDAGRGVEQRWWIVYTLGAAAAMYTHYFAAFLVLALALVGLIFTPRAPLPRRHFACLTVSHLALLALYTPWLFVMLRQLGGDASYLPGPFRLDQALAQLATGAVYGETYLPWGISAWIPLSIATLLAPVVLWRRNRSALLITLLWMIVPTAGVLALAGVVPKFNVRYASLALPGLILLWSGGLSFPAQLKISTSDLRQQFTHHALRTTHLLALLLLATSFLYANRLWAEDSFITRSQWREVAAYIRDHRAPGDAVILSSGHAWPVWDYYAPDIPALRLPEIDVLDVNQVLGYTEAGEILRTGLNDADRVWLVEWQDEVLDPTGVVPLFLSEAGDEARLADADFWHIELARFDDLSPANIDPQPPRNLAFNFGDELILLGSQTGSSGDLLLFWQLAPGVDSLRPDYELAGEMTRESELGRVRYADLPDQRPAAYAFPTSRWRPEQIVVGRLALAEILPGALPGRYTLHLTVYDPDGDIAGLDVLDGSGNPRGKRVALALAVDAPLPLPGQAEPAPPSAAALSTAVDDAPSEAEPGQPVRLAVTWSVRDPIAEPPRFVLRWLQNGETLVEEEAEIAGAGDAWRLLAEGSRFREVRLLRPPLDLPPGQYDVAFVWTDLSVPKALWQIPFTLLPSTRTFELPPLAQPTDASFGNTLDLAGLLEPLPDQLAPAEPLSLSLVWRALDAPPADYSVTVQFLDDAGQPASQADAPLPGGSRSWLADEVVTQTVELVAPGEPGTYRVIAAVYEADARGQPRLATESGADFVELGTLEISTASAPAASGND